MAEETPCMAFGIEPGRARFHLRLARYVALAEAIAAHVRQAPAGQMLKLVDVGVGNGRTVRYLEPSGLDSRLEFHGIDISPRRLDGMYKPERWSLTQADVEKGLPYDDATFDIAVCEQVMEHLHEPQRAAAEIARILKPGGLLVAGVPIYVRPLAWGRRTIVPRIDRWRGKTRDHVQVFTKKTFVRMLESTGALRVNDVYGFRMIGDGPFLMLENHHWWYRWGRFCGRLLPSLCIEIQVLAHRQS